MRSIVRPLSEPSQVDSVAHLWCGCINMYLGMALEVGQQTVCKRWQLSLLHLNQCLNMQRVERLRCMGLSRVKEAPALTFAQACEVAGWQHCSRCRVCSSPAFPSDVFPLHFCRQRSPMPNVTASKETIDR